MSVGETVRFLAVREDGEKLSCEGRIVEMSDFGSIVSVTSPQDKFVEAMNVELLTHLIVSGLEGLLYKGSYHGGILIPAILWKESPDGDLRSTRSAEDAIG